MVKRNDSLSFPALEPPARSGLEPFDFKAYANLSGLASELYAYLRYVDDHCRVAAGTFRDPELDRYCATVVDCWREVLAMASHCVRSDAIAA